MATVTETRTSGLSLGQTFNGLRDTLAARFAAARTYRTTLNELNQLSDRELADLGLHRSQLRGVAQEAAYGK